MHMHVRARVCASTCTDIRTAARPELRTPHSMVAEVQRVTIHTRARTRTGSRKRARTHTPHLGDGERRMTTRSSVWRATFSFST